jgi:cyclohexyl-isocyanide hydratase
MNTQDTSIDATTRRAFLRALAATAAIASIPRATAAETPDAQAHEQAMAQLKPGSENIVILLYPGFTALDAIGPEYILSTMSGAKVKFVAKTLAPVTCETGFEVTPQFSFENCPAAPDLFLIPGGTAGVMAALADPETMDFIRKTGAASKLVGSVCTGSLLLGAAGLLDDYEATSHWQTLELLPLCGARPSKKRVVFDRDRVTGAGVTAGLDLALEIVQRYRGDFYAKGVQLLAQYAPQPPFPGSGDPATADPDVVKLMNGMHKPFVDLLGNSIKAVAKP